LAQELKKKDAIIADLEKKFEKYRRLNQKKLKAYEAILDM
jgi:hypothetical protein